MKPRAEVSATEPDWDREKCQGWWDPGAQLLKCIRGWQGWQSKRGPFAALMRRRYKYRHMFWSAVTGADIPLRTQIGGGLIMPHPNGIVIHPDAVIGPNCLFFQQATIGVSRKPGVPKLGGHVRLGAGARIIGGIEVGDGAAVGANAVVLRDVPPGTLAVGVPARIVTPEERTDYPEQDDAPPKADEDTG